MIVPLLWVSVGILIGDALGWGFVVFLSGAAVSWSVCALRKFPELAFPFLLSCAGAARLTLATTPWSPHDLRHLVPNQPSLVSVRGTLLETPLTRMYSPPGAKPRPFGRATLEVTELQLPSATWIPASGRLAVSIGDELPAEVYGGRLVELTGVLNLPLESSTPGAFDYRAYLRRLGIYFELRTESVADWLVLPASPRSRPPLSDRFQAWGRRMLYLGFSSPDPAIDLLCAMTLGWKPGLDPASEDPFMKSGTMHVFAISGLHIALIAMIGVECLRLVGLSRPLAGFVAVPVIWLYTALTGWQSSAIRSAVMMSIVAGGWMLDRPANLLNNLAGAALVLLCWDPQQLFQPGFQLSFCVVAHLALLTSQADDLLQGVRLTEPYLPDRLQPRWRRYADRAWHKVKPHLSTSAAAWVGSAPLMAHYFNILSPVSLLANLVVVPLSSLALASCVGSLAVGFWLPTAAEWFNHSSWLLMNLMREASIWAAKLPGAWLYVPSPGVLGFLAYYAALSCYLGPWVNRSRRRWNWVWGTVLGTLGVLLMERIAQGDPCQLTLISRRGGAVMWLDEGLGRQKWLVDPGDARETQRVTMPFLQSQGVNFIPNLVLTHPSIGQSGGAELLEDAFSVQRRFLPEGGFRSPSFKRFIQRARDSQLHLDPVGFPESIGQWQALWPLGAARSAAADDAALVLKGTFRGCRVLWLPRLSTRAQDQLLRNRSTAALLEADLVITAMPSRGEPLPAPLLERITPQSIVILDAHFPASAQATPQLVSRLRQTAREVYLISHHPVLQFTIAHGRVVLRSGHRRFPSTQPFP
ncbi:MAG: ComEC/Rec2 family competence protein [Verrucomicrobiales bacterium]|nr:ComEC/Rec2 family competence protein [Verrucomicrobiales bacterium]